MAVRLEGSIRRYIGLSTDRKPAVGINYDGLDSLTVTDLDLPAGSSFLETDTGRIYRWSGTDWTHSEPANEQAEYMQAILFELASIREAIIEGLA